MKILTVFSMNFDSDNFILSSVDSSLENFQDFLDFDFFLSSSDFENTKSKTSNTSSSFQKMSCSQENLNNVMIPNSSDKYKPFKIIRGGPIKLAAKSKKIRKRRRRTKGGIKLKRDLENILLNAPKKYLPVEIENPNLDDKTKRQLVQKVKNRIASKNTRDQRRNYITELEEIKIHLTKANEELNERNRLLEERLRQLENEKKVLFIENQELKNKQTIASIEPVDNFIKYEASPVLSRSSSKGHNNYKFFLGIFMVFAVFSEVKIKLRLISIVQQERREEENLFVSKREYVVHVSHADEERVYMWINDSGFGEEGSMAEEEKELEIVEDDQDRGIVSMVMRLFLFVFCCKKKKENLKKEKINKMLQLRLSKRKSYLLSYSKKVANHKRFLVK